MSDLCQQIIEGTWDNNNADALQHGFIYMSVFGLMLRSDCAHKIAQIIACHAENESQCGVDVCQLGGIPELEAAIQNGFQASGQEELNAAAADITRQYETHLP